MKLSEKEFELADYLCRFPMHYAVPFYYGNPDSDVSIINNATATLVKQGSKRFFITNEHVVRHFRQRQKSEPAILLQVGGRKIENLTSRILVNDSAIDLCLSDVSDIPEDDFRMFGDVPTEFIEIELERMEEVHSGDVVAFGGFPGVFRDRVGTNKVNFNTFSAGSNIVKSVVENQIVIDINHDKSVATLLNDVDAPKKIGGMSGGPVFHVVTKPVLGMRLVAIISEGSDSWKVMMAKPLKLLAGALN